VAGGCVAQCRIHDPDLRLCASVDGDRELPPVREPLGASGRHLRRNGCERTASRKGGNPSHGECSWSGLKINKRPHSKASLQDRAILDRQPGTGPIRCAPSLSSPLARNVDLWDAYVWLDNADQLYREFKEKCEDRTRNLQSTVRQQGLRH
jgi:hypothetical protein